ncbi:MAG: nucleotidyltransferase domain-containing protein [Bacteroidota bacterium]|nr:nucleotidyltransferase domain-containing protein [Bacteroidota bacterium]
MLTSSDILRFLSENKAYIRKNYHCEEIGLFGSFARNEQTDDSDIDLLVVYNPGTPDIYDTEQKIKEYLRCKFNRKIDICSKKWIKPVFKSLVLKDVVYA